MIRELLFNPYNPENRGSNKVRWVASCSSFNPFNPGSDKGGEIRWQV